jgi:hypothetical protein
MEMKNRVRVQICYDKGCNLTEKEYSLEIIGFVGLLNISDLDEKHGTGDACLIQNAVYEWMEPEKLPDAQVVIVLDLLESGEWEDVFWHKYYIVEEANITNLTSSEVSQASDKQDNTPKVPLLSCSSHAQAACQGLTRQLDTDGVWKCPACNNVFEGPHPDGVAT